MIFNFRNWVLQTFPFLEDDFDALTDYELFCKMIEYVKTLVKDNKDFSKRITELENYVYNLDLQDEVNNKLDEMAESGELENLIGQYIELATTYVYNTVSDMKSATNLIVGCYARTSGFYSYNDGGGSTYKIRTVTVDDTVDEKTLIAIDDTTVAELIKENEMNVRMFGAKGDGTTDDTLSIQTALNFSHNVIIKDGTYMVNASTGVIPNSNSHIKIINATLKAITNNLDSYNVLRIYNVENVVVEDGTIEGDRSTHTGETGEWGHCIVVRSSSNITLKNITLKNAWGDGLYVVDSNDVNTYNIIADTNRRNGYSLISVENFSSNNDYILNTNGTAPESGVDIEPNEATEKIKNVVFNNLKTYNNVGAGFDIHLANQTADTPNINITLNNYCDEESNVGIQIYKNQYTKGKIVINNPYLLNNKASGIRLRQCYNSSLNVEINKPTVINCNTLNSSTPKYASAITMFKEDSDTDLALGNVTIREPYLTNYNSEQRYMYISGSENNDIENFKLINPLNNDSDKSLTLQNINNLFFKDEFEQFTLDTNYSMELASYNTFSKLTNSTYQTSRVNTIGSSYAIGREMTFINTNAYGYDLGIKLPANTYIYSLSSSASPTITLANIGDLITIKRISATEFIAINMIGTITAS